MVHALAAAIGVSALIAASPLAFSVLRYAGAAYLAWLGVQALRSWYRGETGIAGVFFLGLAIRLAVSDRPER